MSSSQGGRAPPPQDTRPGGDTSQVQQPPLNPAAIPDERFMVSLRPVFNDILRLAQLLNQPVLTEENQRERDAITRGITLRLSLHSDHSTYYNARRQEAYREQDLNNRRIAELENEIRRLVEIERHLLWLIRLILRR